MAFNPYDMLPVADDALEKGGMELLRAGLAEEELYVTVRRAFEKPGRWGRVLADITLHVARQYSEEGDLTKDNVIALVTEAYGQALRRFVTSPPRAKRAARVKSARPGARMPARKTPAGKAKGLAEKGLAEKGLAGKGLAKRPAKKGLTRTKAKAPARLKTKSKPASKTLAGRKGARKL